MHMDPPPCPHMATYDLDVLERVHKKRPTFDLAAVVTLIFAWSSFWPTRTHSYTVACAVLAHTHDAALADLQYALQRMVHGILHPSSHHLSKDGQVIHSAAPLLLRNAHMHAHAQLNQPPRRCPRQSQARLSLGSEGNGAHTVAWYSPMTCKTTARNRVLPLRNDMVSSLRGGIPSFASSTGASGAHPASFFAFARSCSYFAITRHRGTTIPSTCGSMGGLTSATPPCPVRDAGSVPATPS